MKKLLLIIAVVFAVGSAYAQDGHIYKAQEQLEENKLTEAQATIQAVLANPKTSKMAYAYNVAAQVELHMLNEEINKMQQQEPLDTMKFIKSMDNAVKYLTASYNEDHKPDAKGRVKPKLDFGDKYTIGEQNGNVSWLKKIMTYYLISAQFCYGNGNKEDAYNYYMKHLELPRNVMFTEAQADSIYKSDDRYGKVGYFATIIAFQDKDYDRVLKTVNYAINSNEETTKEDGYHMKTTSLLHKGDTVKWLSTLKEAMENTTNVNYPQIILKYYYDHHQQIEAMKVADDFIAKAPNNKMAYYIKGVVLMDEMKDAEALKNFNKALEIDPNFVEAKANVGVVKFNEIRDLNQKAITNNKDPKYKEEQLNLKNKLTEAKEIFEGVKSLAPDNEDLWSAKLEQIENLIGVIDNNLAEVAKRDKK